MVSHLSKSQSLRIWRLARISVFLVAGLLLLGRVLTGVGAVGGHVSRLSLLPLIIAALLSRSVTSLGLLVYLVHDTAFLPTPSLEALTRIDKFVSPRDLLAAWAWLPLAFLVEEIVHGLVGKGGSTTFGSARFSHLRELLRQDGIALRPPGIYLGRLRVGALKLDLFDRSERHVLVSAPTGAGKTSGTVIPTLCHWSGSTFVFDPKGEIFRKTSGHRARFQRVVRLDPRDPTSGLNPLDLIPSNDVSVATHYAFVIAEALTNPSGKPLSPEKSFWTEQARDILTATILYVLFEEGPPNLRRVAEILYEGGLKKRFADASTPFIRQTGTSLEDYATETLGGIYANCLKAVSLFRIDSICRLTNESSFDVEDLERGLSVYFTVPASQLRALRSLVRLIITLLIQSLTEDETRRRQVLFVLDELPALERFDYLSTALGYARSFGVRMMLVVQGLNNLEQHFGRNQTIEQNCRTQVIYPPADRKTAQYLSQTLGKQTIESLSEGRSHGRHSSRNRSYREAARSLRTADEIRFDMPPGSGFLLLPDTRPAVISIHPYFKDKRLTEWTRLPARESAIRNPRPAAGRLSQMLRI